jgi:hypothetical protein
MAFDVEEYWQIKALSVEWLYMLQKLKDSVEPPEGIQHCIIGQGWDGQPLYLLHRKVYTPTTLGAAFGLTEEKLLSYRGVITLKSKYADGLPEPTVSYWGTA